MRTLLLYFGLFFTMTSLAQQQNREHITLSEKQNDDTYLAGETIQVEAPIIGDAVFAGGTITVKDTVYSDLLVAGGEITIKGYVVDDIRAAGGKLIIDSEVGDDVIVAGGEVFISKNAIIHGNLINFSGDIEMNGKVMGMVKSYSGELQMNGSIGEEASLFGEEVVVNGEIIGASKIAAKRIIIGKNAQFRGNVAYWSEEGEIDFKNSLAGATASLDNSLIGNRDEFSLKGFGIAAFGLWMFYIFSAFLIIVLLNWSFNNFFKIAVDYFDKNAGKSLGYGLIYLFGLPLIILVTFITLIGIPVGLFFGGFYFFSLIFGHLVTAILLSHYLNNRSEKSWDFWTISLLALGIAATIRLLTFIPFLGGLLSLVVIAVGYGLIIYALLQKKAALKTRQ